MLRDGADRDQLINLIGRSNPTILEVGAHMADQSVRFAEWFPYAQVFAFEPDPRPIRNFLSRPGNPRVHMIECALGNYIGKTTFYQSDGVPPATPEEDIKKYHPEGWDHSGSIRPPKEHLSEFPWVKFDNTIEVDVTTLDAWSESSGVKYIDLIWADVQGAEQDLVAGGRKCLRNTRFFYTEFSEKELYSGALDAEAILKLLPEFELIEMFKHDMLLRNKRAWDQPIRSSSWRGWLSPNRYT
ncbi:FkbM family methyltransferase [Methylobacterium sp. J-030]|uniref:FkbM family methyltransferase n=1 Tax=Methylobacterium sp. J-030 TaxID=2836627 RepID=UPI001FBB1DB3|nr:FkbM family methyltransferase [Methylobacterium sp. J-030]MCJ2067468.1 FkbM family methyltransferase [Methylobacterium sp. J-030]